MSTSPSNFDISGSGWITNNSTFTINPTYTGGVYVTSSDFYSSPYNVHKENLWASIENALRECNPQYSLEDLDKVVAFVEKTAIREIKEFYKPKIEPIPFVYQEPTLDREGREI